jgi:hypothetical protein
MKIVNNRRCAVSVWLATGAGVGACEHGNDLKRPIKEFLPAREYTIFTPAQHLRNCREQRPSNKSDLDSNVGWRLGQSILHVVGSASDFTRFSFSQRTQLHGVSSRI